VESWLGIVVHICNPSTALEGVEDLKFEVRLGCIMRTCFKKSGKV
jgi:hypothetical protein